MLSTLILSERSYPAMPLAGQPEHHWSVHFGPLVLEADLLKNRRLQQIKTNLSHAYSSTVTSCMDYTFIQYFLLETDV